MDYLIPNLRYLAARPDRAPQESVGKTAKVGQSAISKIISGATKEPGYRTVAGLAKHFGVSLDDLVNRDLQSMERDPASHPAQLDLVRIGLALTSVDKALSDMVIQGRLGTLAEAVQFAYAKAFKVGDPDRPEDRELYDDLVKEHLRGWGNGRGRAVEEGQREDRQAQAESQKTLRRKG